jgi:hypothetical protein
MMLGKLAPVLHPHAPGLMSLVGCMPSLPESVDWTGKLKGNPMFCNDVLGCCTISAIAHILRVQTSQVWGDELDIPDELVRQVYFGLTGGQDTGLAETTVLEFWDSKGLDLPDRQYESVLSGWCTLNHADMTHLKASVAWFGSAYLGLALPLAVRGASTWTVTPGADPATQPGSWGPHAVTMAAYEREGVKVLTWGSEVFATWDFLQAYLDEAHGPIDRTWLKTTGLAPSGFDLAHLEECMARIGTVA